MVQAFHLAFHDFSTDCQLCDDVEKRGPFAKGVFSSRVVLNYFGSDLQRFLVGRILAEIVIAAAASENSVCPQNEYTTGAVMTSKSHIAKLNDIQGIYSVSHPLFLIADHMTESVVLFDDAVSPVTPWEL